MKLIDVPRTDSLHQNVEISELSSRSTSPKYLICFIRDITEPLDLYLRIGSYRLLSFITFQPLFFDKKKETFINHFICSGLCENNRYLFVYDDLLDIKGGYQGFSLELDDVRVSKLLKRVPVLILIKK
jgi:hypothetical protein